MTNHYRGTASAVCRTVPRIAHMRLHRRDLARTISEPALDAAAEDSDDPDEQHCNQCDEQSILRDGDTFVITNKSFHNRVNTLHRSPFVRLDVTISMVRRTPNDYAVGAAGRPFIAREHSAFNSTEDRLLGSIKRKPLI